VEPPAVPEGAVAKVPVVPAQVLVPAELPVMLLHPLKWLTVPPAAVKNGPGRVSVTVKELLPLEPG